MEVADAVTTAVLYVNQTYADDLKKLGAFTPANQRYAVQLANEKAKDLLSVEAVHFLEKTHGNVAQYLGPKIEAAVKQQK